MYEKQGIDVSYAQGEIDWRRVKESGIEFVMIRAGYGRELSQKDSLFESHYAGAKKAGLKVGAYWYSYAKDVDGARREAEACLQVIKGKYFDYPVAYDLEDPSQRDLSRETRSDIAVAFLDRIEQAGYFAMLYANLDWLRNKLDYNKIKRFSIWLAQWRDGGPTYEHDLGMWQYTSSGEVPGISGRVDRDIAYKDFAKIIGCIPCENKPEPETYPIPTRLIRAGDRGEDVKWLQQQLVAHGYSIGQTGIDGICGTDTVKAIRAFQRDNGLSVDGIAGPDTIKALRGINPFRKPTQNIYLGDWGDGVKWVQWELRRHGYNIGKYGIDGRYGASTQDAVKRFQRERGLAADGIVGAKTRDALEA